MYETIRQSAKQLVSLLVISIAAGCTQVPIRAPKTAADSETSEKIQRELDQVATLLVEAVTLLGHEPDEAETLARFFRGIPANSRGEFDRTLEFSDSDELVLSDGSPVLWKRELESCFLFANGSITTTAYTLYLKAHSETSEVSIQATFGDPFAEG